MSVEWRDRAACRHMGPDVFFPDPADLKGLARAQAICRFCSVKDECADHAYVEGERYGVWAGVNVGIATDAATRARKNQTRTRQRQERRMGPGVDESDPRHGSLNGYVNLGCKCDRCRGAAVSYQLEHKRAMRQAAG